MKAIMRALKEEAAKFQKQLTEAQQQLDTIHAAMKLVSGNATGKTSKRSAAARRKMSLAAKKRWAKMKAAKP